jgi:sulfoxide reductase heme-binding subunit YedZ
VAAIAVVLVLMLVFWFVLREPEYDDHLWNVMLADTSFVLLCLILTLSAVARYVPRLRRFVPWNRELGIAMFVTASLHVLILLESKVGSVPALFSFNSVRESFFGEWGFINGQLSPRGTYLFYAHTSANWVGLFALGYALVLAATSNDLSQRLLRRGWKFTQRQTYTLFVLVWLHTAWFLVDQTQFPPAITWFWMLTALAVVAQMSGFVHTVRSTRGPSPERAPSKPALDTSKTTAVAAARWVAVVALWGLLILGMYPLALV